MKTLLTSAALFAFPMVAFAQSINRLGDIISWAGDMLNRLIPVMIALALVFFFWGLVQYIRTRKNGKDTMIAGLVGLFIMVSVWGIIRIAQNTLGVSNANSSADLRNNIPQVPQR